MMNRYFYLIIPIALCLSTPAYAVFDRIPVGARPVGVAGAFIAIADDANSVFINPAGMSQLGQLEMTSYYTTLFGLQELMQTVLSGVVSTPAGHVGLFYQSLGGAVYRESTVGVAWSHAFGSRLMAGGLLRAQTLSVKDYGTASTASFDAGLLIRLPYQTRLGVTTYNINRSKWASRRDDSPGLTSVGISRISQRLTVAFQVDHETQRGFSTRVGQEFRLIDQLSLRGGLTTAPAMVFFGLGLQVKRVTADYALSAHPVLGTGHHVSVSVRFK